MMARLEGADAANRCLLLLAASVVLAATLFPADPGGRVTWTQVVCVVCVRGFETAIADALRNIALFLPFGVALGLRRSAPRRVGVVSTVLSLCVETAQFAVPGRDPSLRDVIFNVIGAMIGGGITRLVPLWASSADRVSGRFSLAAAVATSMVFVSTDFLLTPSLPDRPYFAGSGQIQSSSAPLRLGASIEPLGHFRGRIDEVRLYRRARTPSAIQSDMDRPVGELLATPDLVAAYDFNEGTGTTLIDLSGHGNSGAVTGAVWTAEGKAGGALVFERAQDVVIVPHSRSLDFAHQMTLEGWVYPTRTQRGWRPLLQKDSDVYFLVASSKAGPLKPGGGGVFGLLTEAVTATAAIPINQWTHLALTYDGSWLALYVNGVLVTSRLRWYPGVIIEAAVGEVPISGGAAPQASPLRERLLASAPIRIRAIPSTTRVATRAPLLTLHDALRNEILLIAAEQDDVVFRLRTRAAAAALDNPALRAREIMTRAVPGKETTLTLHRAGGGYCLDVDSRTICGLRFTLGVGWAFIYSQVPAGWLTTILNATWMAGLLFPFGFWLRRRWESFAGALAIVVGGVLACHVGTLGVSGAELGGSFIGVSAGYLFRRFVHRSVGDSRLASAPVVPSRSG
jgi:VanZ family protein